MSEPVRHKKKNKGGRPQSRMRQVAKLFQTNPFISNKELANSLGVKPGTAKVYRWRHQHEFCNRYKTICPECASSSIFRDRENGERVCRNCGCVIEQDNLVNTLPMGTTYALENHMAFGRSLGGTLPTKQIYQVLASAPAQKLDLPIRSTQIQVMSNAVESPTVRAMLSYSSEMFHALGLDDDSEICHALSNHFGLRVRSFGAFLQCAKNPRIKPQIAARAAMYVTMLKVERNDDALTLRELFPFDKLHLDFVMHLDRLMREFSLSRKEQRLVAS